MSGRGRDSAFQIGPEMWVRLRVVIRDAEGEVVQEEPTETSFVFGFGGTLPALEASIEGLPQGATKSVYVKPAEAFGERDPGAVLEVLRDEFPEDVAPGDVFEAEEDEGEGPTGTPVLLRVVDVTPEAVVLDRNHPLAGQRVRFDVEVVEVRPADEAEISAAEAALLDPGEHKETLIPAASLLRGGPRG
ncbi:MAG: peptidylprolyl isomerase [Myxococcales bacterium]|nr:MAG: peptidylprolyl isomerase [Myxococcales bacterium]